MTLRKFRSPGLPASNDAQAQETNDQRAALPAGH